MQLRACTTNEIWGKGGGGVGGIIVAFAKMTVDRLPLKRALKMNEKYEIKLEINHLYRHFASNGKNNANPIDSITSIAQASKLKYQCRCFPISILLLLIPVFE